MCFAMSQKINYLDLTDNDNPTILFKIFKK